MKYISAQPDELYFLWQLQLQVFNFHSLGIPKEDIHVLVGYDPRTGLHPHFKRFVETNGQACFFCYADTRRRKKYASSIRPHLLKKHFDKHRGLSEETIFYHDSDILLRCIPEEWDTLSKDDTWYVSDTRNYLDSRYIINAAGEECFQGMCRIAGICPDRVRANDADAGGAQYILKKCTAAFWSKIEKDCEKLYSYLIENWKPKGIPDPGKRAGGIQEWCTDMWVMWWNALLSGQKSRIHPSLDFCWANSPAERWKETAILHYTGEMNQQEERYFRKTDYIYFPPFYSSFASVSPTSCSMAVVNLIRRYNAVQRQDRINLSDTSFLIPVRIDSPDRMSNLVTVVAYIEKYFNTKIIILEADCIQRIDPQLFSGEVEYHFVEDNRKLYQKTKYINQLTKLSTTPFIGIYDADAIVPPGQIEESINLLRRGDYRVVAPYDGSFGAVDVMTKFLFSKIMDIEFLAENHGKAAVGTKDSWGGAVFLEKQAYVQSGMDNEHLTSWGPEDVERIKRMEILGYPAARIPGMLFHLYHSRGVNSSYRNSRESTALLQEYFDVCCMTQKELQAYVATWEWV